MAFRSHLARPMDLRLRSNRVLAGLVLVAGAAALVLWLDGEPGTVFLAPVHGFLIWALLREIDPDHQWTALVASAVAIAWVLTAGTPGSGWFALGAMTTARIATGTTGRRPLITDLAGATVVGIAIGFTVEGWAAGFGIALAIYLDDRFRGESRWPSILAASLTAVGTTVVATVADAFPETLPDVVQTVAVAAGVIALLFVVREPAVPSSTVDARHGAFLDKTRLHVSRSIVGILVFLTATLTGPEAEGLVPWIVALGLAVVSNEVELMRRRR